MNIIKGKIIYRTRSRKHKLKSNNTKKKNRLKHTKMNSTDHTNNLSCIRINFTPALKQFTSGLIDDFDGVLIVDIIYTSLLLFDRKLRLLSF